jgi:hypothetical protein
MVEEASPGVDLQHVAHIVPGYVRDHQLALAESGD